MGSRSTVPCPVGPCIRNHSPTTLCCRPCWSMIRGGDGGALAQEVYDAVAEYHRTRSRGAFRAMREVQQRALDKAEARWLKLHGGR